MEKGASAPFSIVICPKERYNNRKVKFWDKYYYVQRKQIYQILYDAY